MFRLRHELDAILLPFRCMVQTRLLYASFNVEHGLSRGFFISLHRNVYIFGKNDTLTCKIYIQENGIFAERILFSNFPFENNIHLKNRIIYMSRILLSKKVYVFFTYTKACCSIGDELLLLQNVPRPWYFTTFIAHAKFSFTRMPTGNAYRFKYDNPILFHNVWYGWL